MTNKTYDTLKWIALIFVPAFADQQKQVDIER